MLKLKERHGSHFIVFYARSSHATSTIVTVDLKKSGRETVRKTGPLLFLTSMWRAHAKVQDGLRGECSFS